MKYQQDFENDLKQAIHLRFSNFGIKIPIKKKLDEMLLDYLTVNKKFVPVKPRQVFMNPELEIKLTHHKKHNELLDIKRILENGRNINYYQSKKIFQTKFHDHLLYEWNIFHFHLSSQLEKDSKFMKRTNELLFVYIDEKTAILLDVENHIDGIFADTKWIEILDKHFPHILKPYFESKVTDNYDRQITPIERQTLWNKGYTLGPTIANDNVYRSPGIGRATSGHNLIVTKTANEILRWLHQLTIHFDKKADEICNKFNFDKNKTKFKLRIGNVTLEVFEINTNTTVLTYPN